MNTEKNTDAADILAAGRSLAAIEHLVESVNEGRTFVVIPNDFHIQDIEKYLTNPIRIKQTIKVETLDAFLAYLHRFNTETGVIFADREKGKITAVLDYHGVDDAEWTSHRLIYTLPPSTNWARWIGANDKRMQQAAFAEFIEDNVEDISRPDGAGMLEMASNLQATRQVNFASALNVANGDVQFTYEKETTAKSKGQIEVPTEFEIGIPPFKDGDAYKLRGRFRYRLEEGKLIMWYSLIDPERVREHAIDALIETIGQKTGLPERIIVGTCD